MKLHPCSKARMVAAVPSRFSRTEPDVSTNPRWTADSPWSDSHVATDSPSSWNLIVQEPHPARARSATSNEYRPAASTPDTAIMLSRWSVTADAKVTASPNELRSEAW